MMPSIIIIGILYILWNVYKHYRDKRKEEEEMTTYNFSEMGAHKSAENTSSGSEAHTNSDADKKDNPAGEATQNVPDYSYETVNLMSNALTGLGCQPSDYGDKTLTVKYQGENFLIECFGRFARIWDPNWTGIKMDDPNLPKFRDAINKTNYQFGPTILLSDPNEDGMIGVHSRYDIMIHPAFPDQVQYIESVLSSFFDLKNMLRRTCNELQAQQMVAQRKRRPVGFTSQEQNESGTE